MKIEITSIEILRMRSGMDRIILHTDLPEGGHPFEGTADAVMYAARDTGKGYCEIHLPGVPLRVTEVI
jgi:hypothetical protein